MATVIYSDGRHDSIMPNNGIAFGMEEIKDIVGGDVEVIDAPDGSTIFANKHAFEDRLDYNHLAARVLGISDRFLCGDVVVLSRLDDWAVI